jgi:hypothetical protein
MNLFTAIARHMCYMSVPKKGDAAVFGKSLTISPCAFRLESIARVMTVHDRTSTIHYLAQSSASPPPPFIHVSRLDPVPRTTTMASRWRQNPKIPKQSQILSMVVF